MGFGNNASEVQIDAAVQPGNSGGPILNLTGGVIAMTSSKIDGDTSVKYFGTNVENVAFGIKSKIIREHLIDVGLRVPKSTERILSRDDLVRNISANVFRIGCKVGK